MRHLERGLLRGRVVGVEQHVRVQVAVAGVEHVAGVEPALGRTAGTIVVSASASRVRGTTPSMM